MKVNSTLLLKPVPDRVRSVPEYPVMVTVTFAGGLGGQHHRIAGAVDVALGDRQRGRVDAHPDGVVLGDGDRYALVAKGVVVRVVRAA